MTVNNYTVYVHINKINGKMYVGLTCKKPEHRFNQGKGYDGCTYFAKAINKYGWDNFEHEIIAGGLNKKEACNFEKLLIKKLKTRNANFGYNIRSGGQTNEGEDNPAWGLKRQDLTDRNLKGSKPILQYDFNGNFIKEYSSIREASREIDKSKNGIRASCSGDYIQAYGYFWFFKKEFTQNDLKYRIENCKGSKCMIVIKYDLFGKEICSYESIEETAKVENMYASTISRYCKNQKIFKKEYILKISE